MAAKTAELFPIPFDKDTAFTPELFERARELDVFAHLRILEIMLKYDVFVPLSQEDRVGVFKHLGNCFFASSFKRLQFAMEEIRLQQRTGSLNPDTLQTDPQIRLKGQPLVRALEEINLEGETVKLPLDFETLSTLREIFA